MIIDPRRRTKGYTVIPKPETARSTRTLTDGVVGQLTRPRTTATLTRTLTDGVVRQTARPRVVIPPRPTLLIPSRRLTPTASGGRAATRSLTRLSGGAGGLIPTARAAAPSRSGITSTGMVTGGLGATLGGIESDLRGTASGIISTAKGFIPTAAKIIAAVIILKIVFWLLRRGRR